MVSELIHDNEHESEPVVEGFRRRRSRRRRFFRRLGRSKIVRRLGRSRLGRFVRSRARRIAAYRNRMRARARARRLARIRRITAWRARIRARRRALLRRRNSRIRYLRSNVRRFRNQYYGALRDKRRVQNTANFYNSNWNRTRSALRRTANELQVERAKYPILKKENKDLNILYMLRNEEKFKNKEDDSIMSITDSLLLNTVKNANGLVVLLALCLIGIYVIRKN